MGRASIDFYATKNDTIDILSHIERVYPVKYASHQFIRGRPKIYQSVVDFPMLGIAPAKAGFKYSRYLICDPEQKLYVEEVITDYGETTYHMAQGENPNTTRINLGGMLGDGVLVPGSMGSVLESAFSKRIESEFRKYCKRNWTKIRVEWVGPEALELLRRGVRLAQDEQCPPEDDLPCPP